MEAMKSDQMWRVLKSVLLAVDWMWRVKEGRVTPSVLWYLSKC